jgi:ribose 5-phosphate isomerase A
MSSLDAIKQAVGKVAADLVKPDMLVGLGTGSTAACFIESLSKRCKEGLQIQAVASSKRSTELAQKGGIPLVDINQVNVIDLTVDGADEIDPLKRMIKGGGGALLREKIVADMSREMIVIIDEKKLVSKLGACPLPLEITPFAYMVTLHKLMKIGYNGNFRKNQDGSLFTTDNGNYILDIAFKELRENPEKDHEAMIHIPGVLEAGFFFNLAGRVVIGFLDGQVVIR